MTVSSTASQVNSVLVRTEFLVAFHKVLDEVLGAPAPPKPSSPVAKKAPTQATKRISDEDARILRQLIESGNL